MAFEKEIALIKNPEIKSIAEQGVALIPEYFYKVPASSSGKYHPTYALGEGGLYRHVQAAIIIAVHLFNIKPFTPDEQDMIITSLILHDGWKQGMDGSGGQTLHNHPLVARDVLLENVKVTTPQAETALDLICNSISSHMGQWTTSKYDSTVLPAPWSEMQNFVHECDFLASRKNIEVLI